MSKPGDYYCKKPCKDCPFRKDTLKGWLGKERMESILADISFTCHKTDRGRQCAGFIIIQGEWNCFKQIGDKLNQPVIVSGQELIFDSQEECIKHHSHG